MKRNQYFPLFFVITFLSLVVAAGPGKNMPYFSMAFRDDTIPGKDSIVDVDLPYEFKDESWDPTDKGYQGGLFLNNPPNITDEVTFDPQTGLYNFRQKIGSEDYRPPSYMTFDEYLDYDMERSLKNNWKQRVEAENYNQAKGIIPKIHVGGEVFDRIFGGNTVDIRPQGSAELIFGVTTNKTDNPALAEKQRKITSFEFDQKIQLNVVGKIGDKLKLTTNYNTEASFDFENQMKLEYTGYEDEIIKKIEAGNVSLPLNGSLITGSQSLFGIKTQLQFGKLTVTTIFSQQKGEKKEKTFEGGAQTNNFEIKADNYESNKHFFLSRYFRNNYDRALRNLPIITSPVNITKIEVWVTNRQGATDNTRNIVALDTLGESTSAAEVYPRNENSTIYSPAALGQNASIRSISLVKNILSASPYNLVYAREFEKVQDARKLSASEFTYDARLGFISLKQSLNNDEVLAVAYQYTVGGNTYQVGEFSTDGVAAPSALILKLLKSTKTYVRSLSWDLMMKNVYSIGAYQISKDNFRLDVMHSNFENGLLINNIPEGAVRGRQLLQVVGLDRLNNNNAQSPDGVFDFIEGVTIDAANGRIYFPVIEPFGQNLAEAITGGDINNAAIANKYAFTELYDSTKTAAQLLPSKNRFVLRGSYQSTSSSEISLDAVNIPQGSVKVSANGVPLVENQDYTVDYNLGRVRIINEGLLRSNSKITASFESNSLFNVQTKSLLGTHIDYRFSKDFTIGATIMNLTERPVTQKINIGDEPISNTIWGLDGNYRTEAPLITKLVDKIPLINTKEPSSVTVSGEFAHLIPGHAKAIGKDGTSYIDDFEGSQSAIDIKSVSTWTLASVPQFQPDLFPEGDLDNNLQYGFNRARLAWYVIDPLFWRDNSLTPSHIQGSEEQLNNFTREVDEPELFPNKQRQQGQLATLPVFDLAFYPKERGPYNYNFQDLNPDGTLNNPESRWAGIMRKLETNDFEASNIEYIQFWLMDPFDEDNGTPNLSAGDLYFNLGDISEDILKDGYKTFENGLPTTSTPLDPSNPRDTSSVWGRLTLSQSIVNAFDNNADARKFQDVGLDGLPDDQERNFFSFFIDSAATRVSGGALDTLTQDPSSDNFFYFRSSNWDSQEAGILKRYKRYGGMENNSSTDQPDGYPASSTTLPNLEDINRDNTLSDNESYYQYKVRLDRNNMVIGENYITDIVEGQGTLKDGTPKKVKWYQFKVPVKSPEKIVGDIQDFRSIRFMRMFMKGFNEKVVLRFARLELIRGEWRKYSYDLLSPGEYIPNDNFNSTVFNIAAVNIEENSSRSPVNYVLPCGIEREKNIATTNLAQLNEQALSFDVCNLEDGDARAAFRNTDMDVRQYKKLKMFVHAESGGTENSLKDNDLVLFVRLGKDFDQNYYEYEMPLKVTQWGEKSCEGIWPGENDVEIDFTKLQVAKQARNKNMLSGGITLQTVYSYDDNGRTINVRGNPNLSDIQTVMVGVRNPKHFVGDSDDGLPKCAEIWINELRLTDFNENGGWAANARVVTKLADFGNITVAGSKRTPGFGSIEQKINERSKEDITTYDVSSNLELGKFIPEKINMRIPMYVNFSESFVNPQFNPLDPDIELPASLEAYPEKEAKDSVRTIVQDYTKKRGINFTNVKKEKGKNAKKPRVYDVENLSLSYSYNEIFRRNINTEYNTLKNYNGALAYNFTTSPKNIRPFSKSKLLSPSYLKIIKDFNYNTMPSRISVRGVIDRSYNEIQTRDLNNLGGIPPPPTYPKTFTINRDYDFRYDLTKAMYVEFNARNTGRIEEPVGPVNKKFYPDQYEVARDSIRESLSELGTTTQYHHTSKVNYTLPINKIPVFNWVTGTVSYTANYDWTRAAPGLDSLGNTIQNSNTTQLNGSFNMTQLYNKIPYFKKATQRSAPRKTNTKVPPKTPADSLKKGENEQFEILKHLTRVLLTLKTASFTYSENNGTLLPGYRPRTQILGYDEHFEGPSTGFLFGKQNDFGPDNIEYAPYAAQQGWLVNASSLNTQYTRTNTKNFSARANLEPMNDLKVELTGNRTFSTSRNEFFRFDPAVNEYVSQSPMENGNFSMSYNMFRTSFKKDAEDYSSEVFQKFLDNRIEISTRLANEYKGGPLAKDTTGFYEGYGSTSQDVVIPAFLAAYSGGDERVVSTNPFPKIPKPNWRVTYDGLSKIEAVKKYFKSVTVGHAYRSTYSVGGYTSNLNFMDADDDGFPDITNRDNVGNFISERQITSISLSEQFSPLVNVDMTWNNSLLTKVELKRDRTVALTLSNNQVSDTKGNEIVVGLGYRFKDVTLRNPFAPKPKNPKKKGLKSDLNLRTDVSVRRNKTIIHKMNVDFNKDQPTAGQTLISIKNSADYIINERLNIRLFYDRVITTPLINTTFPTSNSNAGVSIRFTLQ